jgi:hypothetical protein
MTTIRSRYPRRLSRTDVLEIQPDSTDTQPRTTAQVDKVASARQTPVEKRIGALYAQVKTKETQLKDAEGGARYWSGVAFEVLRSLIELAPDAAAEIHRRAFVTGLACLAEDPALAENLCRTLGRLHPDAAAYIFHDLAHGPTVLVSLADDSDRLETLIAQSPTRQAVELGKLLADAATRHQPLDRATSRPVFTHARGTPVPA